MNNKVTIVYFKLNHIDEETLYLDFSGLILENKLSQELANRIMNMTNDSQRIRSMIARVIISKNVDTNHYVIDEDDNGRPKVIGSRLHFSISHTGPRINSVQVK